jgi:hypothetical protein
MGESIGAFESWRLQTRQAFSPLNPSNRICSDDILLPLLHFVKNGELPDLFRPYKSDFLKHISSTILPSLLSISITSDALLESVAKYIDLFLTFGHSGIENLDLFAINLLHEIVQFELHPCFRSSEILTQSFKAKLGQSGIVNSLYNSISQKVNSFEFLDPLLSISIICISNGFPCRVNCCFAALKRIAVRIPAGSSVDHIISILSCVSQWTSPLTSLDFVSILNTLLQLFQPTPLTAQDAQISPLLFEFFFIPDALQRFLGITCYEAYIQMIDNIKEQIASEREVSVPFIRNLWRIIRELPGKWRFRFRSLFLEIGRDVAEAEFRQVVDCFLNEIERDENWNSFLDKLLEIARERDCHPDIIDRILAGHSFEPLPMFASPELSIEETVDDFRARCLTAKYSLERTDLIDIRQRVSDFPDFVIELLNVNRISVAAIREFLDSLYETTRDAYL